MEEREEHMPSPKDNTKHKSHKIAVPEMTVEYLKRHPSLRSTTKRSSSSSSPSSSGGGGRFNCLCSPTTHAGSFRCRHHRLQGMTRGGSVGSNLSLLATAKQATISDSLQTQ